MDRKWKRELDFLKGKRERKLTMLVVPVGGVVSRLGIDQGSSHGGKYCSDDSEKGLYSYLIILCRVVTLESMKVCPDFRIPAP